MINDCSLPYECYNFFLNCYQGGSRYDDWALKKECNIVETLLEFPSVQATADLLLTQLPALQPVSLPCNAIINLLSFKKLSL